MLGKEFGEKRYILTVLRDVEEEVKRNGALRFKYPWFSEADLAAERVATQVRLTADERKKLDATTKFFRDYVLRDIGRYTAEGRSPPSEVDCRMLAFGQIRDALVTTDDLGMHLLAHDFDIGVWHGYELLDKLRTHKVASNDVVRRIYAALEDNGDLTATWIEAKHTTFIKIFGKPKPRQ